MSLTRQARKRNTKYHAGPERDRRRIARPIATRARPHTGSAGRRHTYITHLIEFGYPERFAQDQAGHTYASTTAIYTGVSDEFRNRLLAKALRERHPGMWEDQP